VAAASALKLIDRFQLAALRQKLLIGIRSTASNIFSFGFRQCCLVILEIFLICFRRQQEAAFKNNQEKVKTSPRKHLALMISEFWVSTTTKVGQRSSYFLSEWWNLKTTISSRPFNIPATDNETQQWASIQVIPIKMLAINSDLKISTNIYSLTR